MASALPYYPWYHVVGGDDVQQGDILQNCPVFSPQSDDLDNPNARAYFDWEERDVIVLTQSCDLVKEREKTQDVLLALLLQPSSLPPDHQLTKPHVLEELRSGRNPAFHLLAPCSEQEFVREVTIVNFHHVWSLSLPYVRRRAERRLHLRLLPPYREHLSKHSRRTSCAWVCL